MVLNQFFSSLNRLAPILAARAINAGLAAWLHPFS